MFGETRKPLGSALSPTIIGGLLLLMGSVEGLRLLLSGEPFSWWRLTTSMAQLYLGGMTLWEARKRQRQEEVK